MKFKIKLATPKDIDFFFGAFSRSLKNHFPHYSKNTVRYFLEKVYSHAALRKILKEKSRQVFLAFDGKQVIGFLLVAPPYGGVASGYWLAVDSAYQRQGVASALLKKWEEQALRGGAHKLQLYTDKRNLNFYRNRGYTLAVYIPDHYFGAGDYLFYKTLRSSKEKNFLKDFLEQKDK